LKGFEAAARHLNFTKAADELFLTQSAVSRQIKSLEDRLGVQLFLRQARGLHLTAHGEQLFRAVSGALRQVSEAMESLARHDQSARITVTSTLALCALWLIPRLGRFHRAHPEIDVRIAANDRVLNLEREHIDVAVRYCEPRAAPKGALFLFREDLTPVCSPALLRDRPLAKLEDLRHHVLLHLDDPSLPSPWLSWPVWLEAIGVPNLKPAGSLVFNYFDGVVRAALAGQGVALGRVPLVRDLLRDGSLVAPFATGSTSERGYFAVTAEFARERPEVTQFVEWLAQEAQEEVQAAANLGAIAQARADPRPQRGTGPASRRRRRPR